MNTYLARIETVRRQIKVSETITYFDISNIDNGCCLIFFWSFGAIWLYFVKKRKRRHNTRQIKDTLQSVHPTLKFRQIEFAGKRMLPSWCIW